MTMSLVSIACKSRINSSHHLHYQNCTRFLCVFLPWSYQWKDERHRYLKSYKQWLSWWFLSSGEYLFQYWDSSITRIARNKGLKSEHNYFQNKFDEKEDDKQKKTLDVTHLFQFIHFTFLLVNKVTNSSRWVLRNITI